MKVGWTVHPTFCLFGRFIGLFVQRTDHDQGTTPNLKKGAIIPI